MNNKIDNCGEIEVTIKYYNDLKAEKAIAIDNFIDGFIDENELYSRLC